jgi:hypothetical protein
MAIAMIILLGTGAGAAVDSPQAPLKNKATAARPSHPAGTRAQVHKPQPPAKSGNYTRYTVEKGDHIFKILMRHFGMSNAAAEALIPEVARLNGIPDIRKLAVGQTILVPARHSHVATARGPQDNEIPPQHSSAAEPPVQQPLSTAQTGEAPAGAAIAVRSISSKDPAALTDALLNILAVKTGKDHLVEATAASKQALRLSAKVDRFFESDGKHYMVSFSAAEPFTYTIYRLLELEGAKLIRIGQDADPKQVAKIILSAMDIPYRYGEHAVLLNDRNHTSATISGFVFTRKTMPPRLVLLTEMPVAALTAQLLESKEKDLR